MRTSRAAKLVASLEPQCLRSSCPNLRGGMGRVKLTFQDQAVSRTKVKSAQRAHVITSVPRKHPFNKQAAAESAQQTRSPVS